MFIQSYVPYSAKSFLKDNKMEKIKEKKECFQILVRYRQNYKLITGLIVVFFQYLPNPVRSLSLIENTAEF